MNLTKKVISMSDNESRKILLYIKTDVFDRNVIITKVEYFCAFYSGLLCLQSIRPQLLENEPSDSEAVGFTCCKLLNPCVIITHEGLSLFALQRYTKIKALLIIHEC